MSWKENQPSETPAGRHRSDSSQPAKAFVADYPARRKKVAEACGVTLAGPGITKNIGFIDEFHYGCAGTHELCNYYASAIENLL